MTMLVLVVGMVMGIPWLVTHYVHRLPYAPECPHCRAVTGQPPANGLVDRVCAVLAATPVRTCARCGWAGRMRWRLAQERVHRRSRQQG
ncbi:hypothetical protein [Longimicrobium sp.]|uniref:hypothetical protein n=1 Tax=Longimicrobium sp. TaxID=2029185 RepID=UPI002C77CC52|nr:hypothetical protein [Longimicrobium sp.]HSU17179.1 hypothetical protein [Longimicrobium sp.]